MNKESFLVIVGEELEAGAEANSTHVEIRFATERIARAFNSFLLSQQEEIKKGIQKIVVERIEDLTVTQDFQLGWNQAVQEQKDRINTFLSSLPLVKPDDQ